MKTDEVIRVLGSRQKICEVLEISEPAISRWGNKVPALRQYQLEVITRGKLKSDFTKKRLRQGKR